MTDMLFYYSLLIHFLIFEISDLYNLVRGLFMSYSNVSSIRITEIVEGKFTDRPFDETEIVIDFPFKDESFFFEFIN